MGTDAIHKFTWIILYAFPLEKSGYRPYNNIIEREQRAPQSPPIITKLRRKTKKTALAGGLEIFTCNLCHYVVSWQSKVKIELRITGAERLETSSDLAP